MSISSIIHGAVVNSVFGYVTAQDIDLIILNIDVKLFHLLGATWGLVE